MGDVTHLRPHRWRAMAHHGTVHPSLGAAAWLCTELGLILRGCRAGWPCCWLVPVTSLTACFLGRPRSHLAGRRGLTINFYWCSAVCTVSAPRPALKSDPEEVPFDTFQAKQDAARRFECPCCHLLCAFSCWEEHFRKDSKGLSLAPW